jgi:hypothetical protein
LANYPTSRTHYCRSLGDLREKRILQILKALLPSNYQVVSHSDVSANGTDIKILHHDKSLAKFEIINEDLPSYIDSKRAFCIRKNLRRVKYKALVCSHGNLTREAKKILKNIPILKLGFQSLPKQFHVFYSKINQISKRKIANSRSLKLVKNLILAFLFKIGFSMHMYVAHNKSNNKSNEKSTYPTRLSSSEVEAVCSYCGMCWILRFSAKRCPRCGCFHFRIVGSEPSRLCDGGNPIFPLRFMVVNKPKKRRKKRVFSFVDRKTPKIEVSFKFRMQGKGNQWMLYDCLDCLCYDFCYKRNDLTKAYERFLEGKGITWFELREMKIPPIRLLNQSSKEDRQKWKELLDAREKMWKCLKGRNRVHIYGNKKGEKKVFFKTLHGNVNSQYRG